VLDGARRDWRVQAHRTRRRWFSGVLKPNAMRPTCLTIRFYASVQGDDWRRRGLRSSGSEFNNRVSVAPYHQHDAVHHAHDVDVRQP
jgi:hypothetical protein